MKNLNFFFRRALAATSLVGAGSLALAPLYAPVKIAQAQTNSAWQVRDSAVLSLLVDGDFADDSNGWVVGLRSIGHTRNGGRDWMAQWDAKQPAVWFNSVAALSPDVAIVAGYAYGRPGGGVVLRTTDDGATWTPLNIGNPDANFHSLQFRSGGKIGYLISTLDGLMKTTDGGLTWNKVATPQDVRRSAISTRGVLALPDDKTIYVGANDNVLLHSGDDGATWDKIELPAEAHSVHKLFLGVRFADAKTGWVNPYAGQIWETRDGGQSWNVSAAPGVPHFQDAQNGWAVGPTTVSQTTDGGKSWTNTTPLPLPKEAQLIALASNSQRLFALGGVVGKGISFAADRLLPGVKEDAVAQLHAPIPIRFTLATPGVVTLAIEDKNGVRVRNLVSETEFPAGENVVYWDGLDESGRKNETHWGVYEVQGKMVEAGTYRVRGLVRKPIDLRYEFTIYNAAQVPWKTADSSSEWLTNHTPPAAIAYLPPDKAPPRDVAAPSGQLLVGSKVAEGGSGLAWLDAENGRKLNGQMWVGGVWTGASQLAVDEGDNPVPGVYAYTGSAWAGDKYNGNKPEVRLHELLTPDQKRANSGAFVKGVWDPNAVSAGRSDARMGSGEDRPLLNPNFTLAKPPTEDKQDKHGIEGLAVRNGILVASLSTTNQLLFVDARAHKTLGTFDLADPRGVAFDKTGRLLVLAGDKLLRFTLPAKFSEKIELAAPQTLVSAGLDDPQGLALDKAGNIYVSTRGALHQVKMFAPDGKFVRAIGKAGAPEVGPYDAQQMHNPYGITIAQTPVGERLWVAEEDYKPKRLSVWNLDGTFERAFYGPTIYGGGGSFDPADKTRFFHDGIEFKIDWKTGEDVPASIYFRDEPGALSLPARWANKPPETPIRANGQLYMTDAYTGHPTNGISNIGIYQMRGGVTKLVAAAGLANDWPELKKPEFAPLLPKGADLSKTRRQPGETAFAWSDLNDNGKVDGDELQFRLGWHLGGVTVLSDLSIVFPDSSRLTPTGFTKTGVPRYDLGQAVKRFDWEAPLSDGGRQILDFPDGTSVVPAGPIQGFRLVKGEVKTSATWTYPNQWPGLHASHVAPVADAPGDILGATRLLNVPMTFASTDAADTAPFYLWGINGNMGNEYLMTSDGLFVATLFKDHRQAKPWPDKVERGTSLNDVSLGGESFFNTISQTGDGKVYVQNANNIIRVDGLDTMRRLPTQTLEVTPQLLKQAQDYFVQSAAARLNAKGGGTLTVALDAATPTVDGKLDDWDKASWVQLDAKTSAAAAVSGDTLYLAYKTGYKDLLVNKPESLPLLFKTGGALDLQIAANSDALDSRINPALGDQRLLITRVDGKTVAVRYRAVSEGEKAPVPFASPSRTVMFDRVDEVSGEIKLAQGVAPIEEFHAGNVFGNKTFKYNGTSYEVAIPLSVLGLKPVAGRSVRGDLGILVGNGFQTIQRVYWNNKATGLVSDVPGEAMLTPQLWGRLKFVAP